MKTENFFATHTAKGCDGLLNLMQLKNYAHKFNGEMIYTIARSFQSMKRLIEICVS